MKKTYIISLISFLLIGICIYFGSYIYAKQNIREIPLKENVELKDVSETASHTTNQTEYILETYNAKTFELTEETLTMPAEYIGKTRTELIELLKNYETNPTKEDKEKGLSSFALICFSQNKIVLRKTYLENTYEDEYEIHVDSFGKITIYQADTNKIYTETDISYDKLPQEIKDKIDRREKIHGLKEIFDFLENYSS